MNIGKKTKLIIISSPSGAGKTTLCKFLLKKMKNLDLSISYTSRSRRLNEINGKDYFFVSQKKFNELSNKKFFIETAKNFNNSYGSPFKNINKAKKYSNHLLFDIDWKGARSIRSKFAKSSIIDFFILPPTIKELKNRLIKRGRDNKKDIDLRLSYALKEMKHFKEYKYILINENVYDTVNKIQKIIQFNLLIEENNLVLKKKLNKIINII